MEEEVFTTFSSERLTSEGWEEMSLLYKVLDYFWHLVLPLTCLVIGSFATLTMLTKNTILEEVNKQYVKTARSKGLNEKLVLYKHVLRNALIPIITDFQQRSWVLFHRSPFGGNVVFARWVRSLSYESVIKRDYPVVMGTLFFFLIDCFDSQTNQ